MFHGYGYPQRALQADNRYLVKTVVYVQRKPKNTLCTVGAAASGGDSERRKRQVDPDTELTDPDSGKNGNS